MSENILEIDGVEYQNDGTLTTMKIGENDTLGFNYNGLKQLIKRTSPNLDMTYVYQGSTDTSGSYTTNRGGEIRYTPKGSNAGTLPTLDCII